MVDDLMFYGRGAGKLPTASAVTADVVEAARNLGNTLPVLWSQDKLELASTGEFKHQFFVRMKEETSREEIEKAFGKVSYVTLVDVKGEVAFVTPLMKEKEYQQKIKAFETVISMIRMNAK